MTRYHSALRIILFIFTFHFSTTVSSQSTLPPLTDSIESKILNETRGIQVKMPNDYKPGSGQKYEVVYILDGEWYYDLVPFTYNFAESAKYLPKSIFVLIRNRYLNGLNLRGRDFSPTKVPQDPLSGGADQFYNFVTKEVVPYIESKYPTNGQRTLVGSSFSGLFSVYAFLKNPAFFQSFVASDPNINWDNSYVTKIAGKMLDSLSQSAGTLYIGGLTRTYRDMGIQGFDSVLQVRAPESLHWKCVAYPDESHYSVQLKAFYDAFRFSHRGYALTPPEFHPMAGLINNEKPFTVYFLNDNPGVRFTSDGSNPDTTSKMMVRDESITIKIPAELRVKTFGNRQSYSKEWTSTFSRGKIDPVKSNKKVVLNYSLYNGKWDSIPSSTASLKAGQSGIADSLFKFSSLQSKVPFLLVIEGLIDVPKDAEYVFYANGYDATQLSLGDKDLFKIDNGKVKPSQSYVVSLLKGKYPMRLVILKKTNDPQPHFTIFQSRPDSEKWWENRWINF